jgi:LPXTG-motif cell wall-anchored protein
MWRHFLFGRSAHMIGRAFAAVGIALGATLGLAAPAFADSPVPLDPNSVVTTAKMAEPTDPVDRARGCDAIADFMQAVKVVPAGDVDGWAFSLPPEVAGEFAEVRLSFRTPDQEAVEVKLPGTGSGWLGHLGSTGDRSSKSAYLVTGQDWTLVGGEATVTEGGEGAAFQLNTTCAGLRAAAGATSQGSDAGPVATLPTPSSAAVAGSGGTGDGGLPSTGVAVGSVLLVGAGLVAAGVALVGLRQRRDIFEAR